MSFKYFLAVAQNNVIGNGKAASGCLWFPKWVPQAHYDLLNKKTKDGVIIYGHNTWELNGRKLLFNDRYNIILSRETGGLREIEERPGAFEVSSIKDLRELPIGKHDEYWVIGGLQTFLAVDPWFYMEGYITHVNEIGEGKLKFPHHDYGYHYCEKQEIVQKGANFTTVRYDHDHPCI